VFVEVFSVGVHDGRDQRSSCAGSHTSVNVSTVILQVIPGKGQEVQVHYPPTLLNPKRHSLDSSSIPIERRKRTHTSSKDLRIRGYTTRGQGTYM